MPRRSFTFCLLLAVLTASEALLPDEIECPSEAFINTSSFNRSATSTGLDFQKNDTSVCACEERLCLSLCCPMGSFIIPPNYRECIPMQKNSSPEFPAHHDPWTLEMQSGQLRVHDFHVLAWDPCRGGHRFEVTPESDDFKLLSNGSMFFPPIETAPAMTIHFDSYCFAAIANESVYRVMQCLGDDYSYDNSEENKGPPQAFQFGLIISVPCLFLTFVVYSILPQLKNMHGFTLRGYVGSLMVAYIALAIVQLVHPDDTSPSVCKTLAFVIHFSFLASFFWLNVMCFDIWWTFGGFRSLQGSVRQRERKKFIIYSAYAWGSAWILTGICLIMDLVPSVPKTWIRPEFGAMSCWFRTDKALALYFYGPMGLTVVCNICLFISTALKIIQHKKDTAHHLKGMDSRRHDDNKQWFNLYLKLFIVMGINWSMEIVSWLFKNGSPSAVWYLTDLANTLQGVIIFVIFVWKDKIKRLLLKRLGFRDRNLQSGNSTRSAYHSSASRTCTTTGTAMAPLQEKISNPYVERTKITTDESDCI